jgi:hypothetical protein
VQRASRCVASSRIITFVCCALHRASCMSSAARIAQREAALRRRNSSAGSLHVLRHGSHALHGMLHVASPMSDTAPPRGAVGCRLRATCIGSECGPPDFQPRIRSGLTLQRPPRAQAVMPRGSHCGSCCRPLVSLPSSASTHTFQDTHTLTHTHTHTHTLTNAHTHVCARTLTQWAACNLQPTTCHLPRSTCKSHARSAHAMTTCSAHASC